MRHVTSSHVSNAGHVLNMRSRDLWQRAAQGTVRSRECRSRDLTVSYTQLRDTGEFQVCSNSKKFKDAGHNLQGFI